MLSITNHFLDTNMILSIAFEDSNFNECKRYYKLEYKRHISYNVKKEIRTVIERMRLIANDIIRYIKEYLSSKGIKLSNLEYHIQKIKKGYIQQYKDETHVYKLKKDKFLEIVNDLFVEYIDEIKTDLICNNTQLNTLSSKIRNTFKKYNKTANKCLTSFETFSFDNNSELIDQLIDIGIHEKDAILVDDCSQISNYRNEEFVFVTNDTTIIECSFDASKLLDSMIYFSKPSRFLKE